MKLMGNDTQVRPSDWDEGKYVKSKRTSPRNGREQEAATYLSKKSNLSSGTSTKIFPAQVNRNKRKSTRALGQRAKL